jgi:hypothetical protein
MKENYDLSTPPRKNPYAETIKKNGYSVAIHYETPEDIEADHAVNTIKGLLKQPGLTSIHLYLKNSSGECEG